MLLGFAGIFVFFLKKKQTYSKSGSVCGRRSGQGSLEAVPWRTRWVRSAAAGGRDKLSPEQGFSKEHGERNLNAAGSGALK